MSWERNNNTPLPPAMANIYGRVARNISTTFYRSRNPLNANLFQQISMLFKLPSIPEPDREYRTNYKTMAMPRGIPQEDTLSIVRNSLETDWDYIGETNRYCTIVNTNNNSAMAVAIISDLKEDAWEQKNYSAALICTPFHNCTVLQKGNKVAVFTDVMTNAFVCKLGGILPILYGYTIPDALSQAFINGDKRAYVEAYMQEIEALIKEAQMREIKETLDSLRTNMSQRLTQRLDEHINNKAHSIAEYEEQLRILFTELQEARFKRASTEWENTANSVNAFIEYLHDHELPIIIKAHYNNRSNRLVTTINSALAYWDDDVFNNYVNSPMDNCVTRRGAEVRDMFKAIFKHKTVEVLLSTAVDFRFDDNVVVCFTDPTFYVDGNRLPHPHVHGFGCWGNNKVPITKALTAGDYIIAWEQVKATLAGINLTDTTVFNSFCNDLVGTNRKCLRIKATGEVLSPTQFKRQYPTGLPQ